MHAHLLQEEGLTVQRGRMAYQRPGQPPQFAGVGESVVFKPGEAHKFWNAGDGDLECLGYIEPPDNIEYFLTQLFDSTRRNGGKAPNMFEAAYLIRRYRSEFVMLEIPALVQLARVPDSRRDRHFTGQIPQVRRRPRAHPTLESPYRRQRADPTAHTFFTRSASKAGMPVRAMRRRRSSRNPGWAHAWAGVVISVIRAAGPR